MSKRLGHLGAQVLAFAQMRQLRTIRTAELAKSLHRSSQQMQEVVTRLARSGFVVRVRRGLYLVPPRLPLGGTWSPDPILAINTLMEDRDACYQVCGPNAFNRYGFDEQVPARFYVYNNRLSGDRTIGSVEATLAADQKDAAFCEWLTQAADAMSGSDWIADAGINVGTAMEAASVLGRAFVGRWLMAMSEPISMPRDHLSADVIAACYEAVRREDSVSSLPAATACGTWWLSKTQVRRVDVVLFDAHRGECSELRWGLALDVVPQGNVITPIALFDAGTTADHSSARDRNQVLQQECDWLNHKAADGLWPTDLREAVGVVIRRVRNQQRWAWVKTE